MAGLSARARLYQKINDSLVEDDVRSLRALLVSDEHLGKARVENATPQELFNMLEDDNKIGKGNLALLVDLLKTLGKTKLAQETEDVTKRDETEGSEVQVVMTCLRDLYATEYAHVRPLPWCEDLNLDLGEVYTNLQLQRRDKRGRFMKTSTIVSLADIYKPYEGGAQGVDPRSAVRKIRVEGPPGIGKSCSCQKLAHDWSSGKLDSFKAVFFLEMRHLSGNVKDAIFEQLLPRDTKLNPDILWSYIEENQEDVLFVLDGLDELSQTARESTDVLDLIQGNILRKCHVLVTSRPYQCVRDLEKCHEFYQILGYNKDDSVEFIRKYFSKTPKYATKLVKELKTNSNLSEIVVNPLNNVLICVVWEDSGGKLPESKAELYQMIVYSVAKRCCSKKRLPTEGNKLPSILEEALLGLGKLSWEGLQQDQLQFNIDDIRQEYGKSADDMLNMGLLTRDYSFARIKRNCYCAFLHKTFQEYMAAYYISELIKNESKRGKVREHLCRVFGMLNPTDGERLITESHKEYREVQNMLPVLLGDKAGPLFEFFAGELNKTDSDERDRDLLSFICVMSLGRCTACENSKMAEIVAPSLSPHISNKLFHHPTPSADDHANWFDGFLHVLSCQKKLTMNHSPNVLQHLTVDCYCIQDLQQQQLDKLKSSLLLLHCVTLRSVTLLYSELTYFSEYRSLTTPPGGNEIRLVCMFIPSCGVQSLSIDFPVPTLEPLSKIPRLENIKIDIGRASNDTGVPKYDRMLAEMITKQSSLRSLSVRISGWEGKSVETRRYGNLTATLQTISEHKALEVAVLEHAVSPYGYDRDDRYGTVDVDTVVQKLTECIDKNKKLKTLQIIWDPGRTVIHSHTEVICSSQSLSDLCSAIQRNRTLERLAIGEMFSESEGHQDLIDQLMLNKPGNLKKLKLTMIKWKLDFTTDSNSDSGSDNGSGSYVDIDNDNDTKYDNTDDEDIPTVQSKCPDLIQMISNV